MPVVEKTSGGVVYVRSLDRRFAIGDQVDVSTEQAARLCEGRGDFERVNETASDVESSTGENDDGSEGVAEADQDDGGEEPLEPTETLPADTSDESVEDSTGTAGGDAGTDDGDGSGGDDFSVNEWLENNYQDRADAVREGGLDDHLDEIEDAETSETVIDAVQERRGELED